MPRVGQSTGTASPPLSKAPLTGLWDAVRRLDEIREFIAELPPEYGVIFAGALRATAETFDPTPAEATPEEESGESRVQMIAHYFADHSNRPATIAEIVAATGIPYQTLRTFIYTRHKHKFSQVTTPVGKPGKWQWKDLLPSTPETAHRAIDL